MRLKQMEVFTLSLVGFDWLNQKRAIDCDCTHLAACWWNHHTHYNHNHISECWPLLLHSLGQLHNRKMANNWWYYILMRSLLLSKWDWHWCWGWLINHLLINFFLFLMVCNCSPKKKRQEIRKISYLLFNYSNNSFELDQNVKFNYFTVKHKFTFDDLQNDFTSPRKGE